MLDLGLQSLACSIPCLPAQPHLVLFPPSPGALPLHTGLLSDLQTPPLSVGLAGIHVKEEEGRERITKVE